MTFGTREMSADVSCEIRQLMLALPARLAVLWLAAAGLWRAAVAVKEEEAREVQPLPAAGRAPKAEPLRVMGEEEAWASLEPDTRLRDEQA